MICGAQHPTEPETTCGRDLSADGSSLVIRWMPHYGICGNWQTDYKARAERLASEVERLKGENARLREDLRIRAGEGV